MIPEPALLEAVHPTERITAGGRPTPEFREQLDVYKRQTMSVNRIVANIRSPFAVPLVPVRNSSISPSKASVSPTKGRWSRPGSSTSLASGMCSARYRP